jgi:hypothetical protein
MMLVLKEIRVECVDWIDLTEGGVQPRTPVSLAGPRWPVIWTHCSTLKT